MTMTTHGMTRILARVAVVAMVGFGATACSSVPDWVDPTNWGGDGSTPAAATTGDNSSFGNESPDLAAIPDRPDPSSTSDEQQQVANSLAADRSKTQYSADALRGGTEPVAPPPAPPSQDVVAANEPPPAAPPPAAVAPSPDTAAAPAAAETTPAPQASTDNSIDTNPANVTASADTSISVAEPPPAASQLPPATPSAQSQVAMASPPPRVQSQSAMPSMAQINPSDAALGFRPSSAPPLDNSIGQFVPQPIVARYNQTASGAGLAGARYASAQPAASARSTSRAMGGPDRMSGSVVANLDAIPSTASSTASAYANPQGMPPAAVVLFPGDGTLLGADAKARVRAAVAEFRQRGGQGFIRVVGHASSRTSNMPVEKHLEFIFNKSQDRANAVAKEVIRQGVPANRVLVEAVGDSQPVYYESMPKGEDGNRRAEIFLQS